MTREVAAEEASASIISMEEKRGQSWSFEIACLPFYSLEVCVESTLCDYNALSSLGNSELERLARISEGEQRLNGIVCLNLISTRHFTVSKKQKQLTLLTNRLLADDIDCLEKF